ncbi:hypothetical protein [Maribacter stanieri]|uniref:hypothetical protein n=1 Tax=Maribacter stanieri TaxID=440514 RepID=UPI00249566CA|nr:hypothetical protein [Maribacter stanieri]
MRFICCVLLFMISCNSEKKTKINLVERKLVLNIPDSLELKDTLNGYVEYKNHIESLDVKNIQTKFTFLYLTKSDSIINSLDELKKIPLDTFVQIENNIFPIYDLTFDKRGTYYLQGYIEDQYFINHVKDSTKIIYGTTEINHILKVY